MFIIEKLENIEKRKNLKTPFYRKKTHICFLN